jgi:hypothetical protein
LAASVLKLELRGYTQLSEVKLARMDRPSYGSSLEPYTCTLPPRSMGLLGVARAYTAVGVSPETFLLLLLQVGPWKHAQGSAAHKTQPYLLFF